MSMTSTSSTTFWVTNGSAGMALDATRGPKPEAASEQLLSTRAVESKGGWLGQIIITGDVVWETKPQRSSEKALKLANRRIVDRIRQALVRDPD